MRENVLIVPNFAAKGRYGLLLVLIDTLERAHEKYGEFEIPKRAGFWKIIEFLVVLVQVIRQTAPNTIFVGEPSQHS